MSSLSINFKKYHGLGNDFIVVDFRQDNFKEYISIISPNIVKKLCSRNFGIGADGLIIICNPTDNSFVKMKIINADGSEAEMCGNGIRCLMNYLYDCNEIEVRKEYSIQTLAGTIKCTFESNDKISVNMGRPILDPENIPTKLSTGPSGIPQGNIKIENECYEVAAVGMGNPHLIVPVLDISAIPFFQHGPLLEKNDLFPSNTNVHFINVLNDNNIDIKVWERGVGPTLACGTGACATLVAAYKLGLSDNVATINLPGGSLFISWPSPNSSITMTGPSTHVFDGTFRLFDIC